MKIKNKIKMFISLGLLPTFIVSASCNELKEIPKEKETNEKPVEIVSEPSKDLEPDKGLNGSTNTGGKQSEVPSETPSQKPGNDDKETSGQLNSEPTNEEKPNTNGQSNSNQTKEVDFSSLESLELNPTSYIKFYNQKHSDAAWIELKKNFNSLISELNISQEIKNEFNLELVEINKVSTNKVEGVINNIKIKFTKDNQSVIKVFSLNGFAKYNDTKVNHKNNFLTQNELNESLTNLFPSLVARMMLYSEKPNEYLSNTSQNNFIINFEALMNRNNDLFTSKSPNFNAALKETFFSKNPEFETKYVYKIVAAKYNDLTGTLGLEVFISDSDENPSDEPGINKQFIFSGFRRINKEKPNDNVLSFFMTPSNLKESLKKNTSIKNKIIELKNNNELPINLNSHLSELSLKLLELNLYSNLLISIIDNKGSYNLRHSDLRVPSLVGLTQEFALYPFYTRYTKDDIIKNLNVSIKYDNNRNQKMIEASFNVRLSIAIQESYNNLVDNFITEEYIEIPVIVQTPLDTFEQ